MRRGTFQFEFVPMGEDFEYTPNVDDEQVKRENIRTFCTAVRANLDLVLGEGRVLAGLGVPVREFEFEEIAPDVVLEEEIRSRLGQALELFDLEEEQAETLAKDMSGELDPFFATGSDVHFGITDHPSTETRFYCYDMQGNVVCYGQYRLTIDDRPALARATALDGEASIIVQWQFPMFQTPV